MNRPEPTDRAPRIFELIRVFNVPREEVFRHLVEPDLIAHWWGPDGFVTPADRVQAVAEVGGVHTKTMVLRSEEIAAGMGVPTGTEFPDTSTIVEISPPGLLVLASEPQPEIGVVKSTIARIELHAESPARTRLVLVDGPYGDAMAPLAEAGWSQMFGKLERLLAG